MSAPPLSDTAALLRRLMRLFVLKPTALARLEGMRSLAKLPSSVLDWWNQPEEVSRVNGWTLLFEVMTEKEVEETSFREGGQVDAVQALLDAGIAVTMALPAFLAQPAFRSTNPHHERLFRFLLERTAGHAHTHGRLVAPLLRQCALPARCPDNTWRKAIQQTCDRPTPQFAAQLAKAEAKVEARKRKAAAAARVEEEQEEDNEEDESSDSSADEQPNARGAGQPTTTAKVKKAKKPKKSRRSSSVKRAPTTDELIKELESMIGMEAVIAQVKDVVIEQKVRHARANDPESLPNADVTMHLLFSGSAGTGKTTVARLVAAIYKSLGILSKGTYREVKAVDLQGTFVGHSEVKTKQVLEESIGGVLFIDEVYTLADKSTFGSVIVNTMLTYLEEHRGDLVVIAAGYPDGVEVFLRMNEGLRRRFPTTVNFTDYEPAALVRIATYLGAQTKRYLTPAAEAKLLGIVQADYDRRLSIAGYGNGGDVRIMMENAIKSINRRLPDPLPKPLTDEVKKMMHEILPEDIQPLPRHAKSSEPAAARGALPVQFETE